MAGGRNLPNNWTFVIM